MSTDLVPLLDEEQSDHALIEAHRAGVDEAFDELCLRYRARLVDLLIRRTRDRGLAEDLAQETFLRAYQSLDTFDAELPIWPWLRTIAGNLATDHGRSPAGRAVPTEHEPLIDAVDVVNRVEDHSDQLGERQLLADALSALNPRQRAAVGLRYLDGWSVAEIGRVLGMDPNAVAQLLMRSRRRLCAAYDKLTRDGVYGLAWPLLLPLHRLRDRLARLRDTVTNAAPGPAMASAEALATTAAVGALTAAIAVGSLMSPSPSLAEVSSQSPDRVTPVSEQGQSAVDASAPATLAPTASDSFATAPAMPAPPSSAVTVAPTEVSPTSGTSVQADPSVSNDGETIWITIDRYRDTPLDPEPAEERTWVQIECGPLTQEMVCGAVNEGP